MLSLSPPLEGIFLCLFCISKNIDLLICGHYFFIEEITLEFYLPLQYEFLIKNHKKYTKNVNNKLTKFVFEYKIIFTVFRKGGKNMNENKKGLKMLLGIFLSLMVIAFIVITSEGSFAGSSTSGRRLSGPQSEPASYQLGAGLAEVNDRKEKNELGNHPEENLREPQIQNEEVKETPSQTDINPFAALAYALLGLFGLGSVSFGKVFQEFLQSYSRNKGVYVKEKDRENVLSLINTGATKEYEIDDAGFLKESVNQPQKEGSKTFTQMVDKLINADKKTVIGFDDKVLKIDENGKAYQQDVLGINVGTNGTDQVLVINPDFSSTIGEKETIGLLAHEMAHAIDGIEGTKTNDAFTNEKVALGSENNVREELGLDARELDTDDVKGDGVYSYAAPIILVAIVAAGKLIKAGIVKIGSKYAIKVGSTLFYAQLLSKTQKALVNFNASNFTFGNTIIRLGKTNMEHILTRHHPQYWTLPWKQIQSYLSPTMSIQDVRSTIAIILHINRNILTRAGTQVYSGTLYGIVNGVRYVMHIKNGIVQTLYPAAETFLKSNN
jgi:hypothetical protein